MGLIRRGPKSRAFHGSASDAYGKVHALQQGRRCCARKRNPKLLGTPCLTRTAIYEFERGRWNRHLLLQHLTFACDDAALLLAAMRIVRVWVGLLRRLSIAGRTECPV